MNAKNAKVNPNVSHASQSFLCLKMKSALNNVQKGWHLKTKCVDAMLLAGSVY